jgi:glutamyl-tRNA reductase
MSLINDDYEAGNPPEASQVRLQLQEIALNEIVRHRNQLGSLTEEQHSAIEALLISTADQISGRLIQRIQHYPIDVRNKYLNLWRRNLFRDSGSAA